MLSTSRRNRLSGTNLTFSGLAGTPRDHPSLVLPDGKSAANYLMDRLEEQSGFASIRAVGHRVVQGMQHTRPELVTQLTNHGIKRLPS